MTHKLNTTHTVDMQQIADLNDRLTKRRPLLTVTAADLGLDGAAVSLPAGAVLQGAAVLVRVSWDGSPEFPYVRGHFTTGATGSEGSSEVEFHTRALRDLSHRLGARHVWGLGSVPEVASS